MAGFQGLLLGVSMSVKSRSLTPSLLYLIFEDFCALGNISNDVQLQLKLQVLLSSLPALNLNTKLGFWTMGFYILFFKVSFLLLYK